MGDNEIKDKILFTDKELKDANKCRNNKIDLIYNITNNKNYTETDNKKMYKLVKECRDTIRTCFMKYNYDEFMLQDTYKVPFNIERIIYNNIENNNKRNDLHPTYIV